MIQLDLQITCTICHTVQTYPFTKGKEWYEIHDDPSVLDNVNKGSHFDAEQFNSETAKITCTVCNSMIEFSL